MDKYEIQSNLLANNMELNEFERKAKYLKKLLRIKDNPYFGRIDFKSDKNYQIVLIGLDYDKTLDKSKILDLPNVHFLGKKEYNDLPQYLHAFDICMIPFVINEITLSTSPVKAFEYMAARKPIVTTDLPECRKYKSILIGKDDNDFVQKIKNALDKRNDEKYLDILTKEAKENEWQNKFKELINLISSGESYEG